MNKVCLDNTKELLLCYRSLSKQDIHTVVEKGCPNILRKVVNSGKRLRIYVQLDEGDVSSLYHMLALQILAFARKDLHRQCGSHI